MLIDYPLTRWSLTCLKLRRLVSELLFKMNEAVYDQGCNEDVLTVTVPKLDDAAAKGGPNESDAEIRKETSPPLTDWSQTEAPFSYENPPNEDELRALLSKDEYALVDGECERIRNHSKFKEYEQWIKNEFGADNPDWIFGDLLLSDPLEDVIGFVLDSWQTTRAASWASTPNHIIHENFTTEGDRSRVHHTRVCNGT